MSDRSRVVVVGAGFGGLECTKALAKHPVDVTLVDRNNFHTFLPLLYQVATAGLNAADVAHPARAIIRRQRNASFRQATVTGVDWGLKHVELDGQPPLPFDHLVVAAGASAEWFGVQGAAEHALPLYSLTDAVTLRNHVLDRFEAADADPSLIDDGALTFVVVGGGPTGVETAGALSELFTMVLRADFRDLDVGRARVVLVEAMDNLLGPFSPTSQGHALRSLQGRGVDVRLGCSVKEIRPTRVTLTTGELPAHTVVWGAGVRANPLAAALGVETGKGGRVVVGDDLRIPGHPEAFVLGDIAAIADGRGGILPGLAPVAIQGGHHVAAEIGRAVRGGRGSPKPFRYRNKGTMATIGRSEAVAELPLRITLSGRPAWFAWLGLHLLLLAGFRNRLSVFLNWAWNYLTWDRGSRIIFGEKRAPDARRDAPSSTST